MQRHARAGEQPALRLRQLALRLRRATRASRATVGGKMQRVRDGHVSVHGRTARRSSSCTSSRTTRGAQLQNARAISSAARRMARRSSTAAFRRRVVPAGMRAMTAKKINVEDKAHAITPNFRQVDVFGGYTAAAGSAFIDSANLPARLQGKAMVCEPTMKLDLAHGRATGRARATWRTTASTSWRAATSGCRRSSPKSARTARCGLPTGRISSSSTTRRRASQRGGYDAKTGVGGAHENPLRDHPRGRIYRVVWDKAKRRRIASLQGREHRRISIASAGRRHAILAAHRAAVARGGRSRTDAADALEEDGRRE